MTTSERMRTCERMKKAARRAIKVPRTQQDYNHHGEKIQVVSDSWQTMEYCWRLFPENYYTRTPAPSPLEIIAICERMEREAEEDKRFAEAMK